MILVNLATGERIDLGPGHIGLGLQFDPTSSKFVWLEAPADPTGPLTPAPVEVFDLARHTRRSYGQALTASLSRPNQLFVQRGDPAREGEVDLATGVVHTIALKSAASLEFTYPASAVTVEQGPFSANPGRDGWRFVVVPRDGDPAIVFRAVDVIPDRTHRGVVLALIPGNGSDNLFRIDVDTARATFVATAHFKGASLPVVVTTTAVVMSDGQCGASPRLLLYDMSSGTLTAVRTPLVPSTALGGALGLDGRTQTAWLRVDLASLAYTGVLPAPGAWSPDGRWAAIGPLSAAPTQCSGATAP